MDRGRPAPPRRALGRLLVMLALLALVGSATPVVGQAAPAGRHAFTYYGFEERWAPADAPLAQGQVQRSWVWGPAPFTPGLLEPYAEAPGGQRLVQYLDKGRFELTDPDLPVTTGLLARELVTGQVQVGDARWEQRAPAAIPVAGDLDDPAATTYASLAVLLDQPPVPEEPVTQRLDSAGRLGTDPRLASYAVLAGPWIPETGHHLATTFADYLAGEGLLARPGGQATGPLFPVWWQVTCLPLTEPVWARVRVGGVERDVLIQLFERRVLTYTPDNPAGWQVEMGNVGQHYYQWRYAVERPREEEPGPAPEVVTRGEVRIVAVDPAPSAPDTQASVTLRSLDPHPVELTGWRLSSSRGRAFAFPPFTLAPGATVRVWICRGTDDAANLYWGWCAPVWQADGDTIILTNQAGEMMHRLDYDHASTP